MIPRYQRILFWTLVGGIFLMAAFLIHGCQQAHKRLTALNDATPIAAPTTASTQDVTLYLANDADGSIAPDQQQIALPQDPTLRARALLEHLLGEYALPTSAHVLQSGPAVDDVFFLPLPITTPAPTNTLSATTGLPQQQKAAPSPAAQSAGEVAVVNLHGSFVENHPSGIEVENLTLLSIIGTLHANFPKITEVRFLVDGQAHDTLAGHADLKRSYLAIDTTTTPTPPQPEVLPRPQEATQP
ncbi:MAG TPA: GerMN domain-containing protein [Edaphobacter sp.]|uniref:GerMN domain-containing protein n=1 Tax=Edaphobacter sp. TaxID=1934404 RepID=UPI002C59D6D8|nr:GerMN domain-containing protein [Edaphobacter sp.]HUZ94939.1 GerMN domain-containing protein [Edaphobacter sp.]